MSQLTPARKLFDLLVSRDFDPEMLDVSGKPAPDPAEAEIFSFDFRAQSGKDYGTVVIMLSNEGDLEVYCADNVGKTMEGTDKTEWFQFLEQLKNFAVRNNRMNFGIKNLNHLRYSMQGQAAIKEGLFESWAGKKDVSYNAGATESRLMIKHKRNLGEDEARFRYVESLFIETAEGERSIYDLIFLDPPTFSNSKRMEEVFDIQNDYVELINNAVTLLAPEGILYFSTNFRRFKMDSLALADLNVEEITAKTIPEDFSRNPKIHYCWKIMHASN